MKKSFSDSRLYWQERYDTGGNSGAGSYGRLAKFKATVLNDFIATNNVHSVIEWGCGDGNQLSLINYPEYIGIDVSSKAISLCQLKFKNDTRKKFYNYIAGKKLILSHQYELSLSLDVIFHLVEDLAFDNYMRNLFSSSNKFVIIYSSNIATLVDPARHVLHREFTKWNKDNLGESWSLIKTINNKYPWDAADKLRTSFSDFYIFQKA